jgi:siderophore synthetase component
VSPDGWPTTQRVIAALVNEGLAPARVAHGVLTCPPRLRVPLRHDATCGDEPPRSGLLQPDDLAPPAHVGGVETCDPVAVLRAVELPCAAQALRLLEQELASAVLHQRLAESTRRPAPGPGAPALAWEQAIVDGHPTHPCHRTRLGFDERAARHYAAEHRGRFDLRFVAVPADAVEVHGPFAECLAGFAPSAPPGHVVLPVHPAQLSRVAHFFPRVRVLPDARPAQAQAALRTVCPDALPWHLKLPLAVHTTSALRTLSPSAVAHGPVLSALARRVAHVPLHVVTEVASAGVRHADPRVARHLACIVREDPEPRFPGDVVVVCAALSERDASGACLVRTLADAPPGGAVARAFFDSYAQGLCDAVLPPLREHGLALEAHAQNTLVHLRDGRPVGFAVRDFGGVRVHLPTLEASGLAVALRPGAIHATTDAAEASAVLFHAAVRNHLEPVARALGLGADAWTVARAHVDRHLAGSPWHALWVAARAPAKSLLRMRLGGHPAAPSFDARPNPLARAV